MRRRHRSNPPLVVVNPPARRLLGTPLLIQYQHAEDGELYEHKFSKGARVYLLDDGSVRIEHANSKPMWGEF